MLEQALQIFNSTQSFLRIPLHANQNFVPKSPFFLIIIIIIIIIIKIDVTPNMYIIHQKKFIFLGNKEMQDFLPSHTLNCMTLYATIDEE